MKAVPCSWQVADRDVLDPVRRAERPVHLQSMGAGDSGSASAPVISDPPVDWTEFILATPVQHKAAIELPVKRVSNQAITTEQTL